MVLSRGLLVLRQRRRIRFAMMKRAGFAVASFVWVLTTPAAALDLNSFRAQHGRPALSVSSTLSALAYSQAHSMATRTRLDHAGFRARIAGMGGGMHAENVAFGCDTEDCALKMWARSGGHRANMLRGDVAAYGIASATGANGRRYWALELGN
jgi:uncharacterized protein YkwD